MEKSIGLFNNYQISEKNLAICTAKLAVDSL
jgi:hypothetical protein